jgi:putative FmdB family regulatory protein
MKPMPTYEYRCPRGHEFELFQRMSDEPRADCPECGAESARLLSAGAGFLFRGDGFYITDYRSDAYRTQKKKEEGGGTSAPAAPAASGGATGGGSGGASAPATPSSSSSTTSSSSSSSN